MAVVDEDFRREGIIEEPETTSDTSTTSTTSNTSINSDKKDSIPGCTNPETVFAVATSFSYFLASNFNKIELETLINIMGLIVSNISAIITQVEICEGESVVSLPE